MKTKRKDGDKRLVQGGGGPGSEMSAKLFRVKHLEIKSDGNDTQFWISTNRKHDSLRALIEYYQQARGNNIQ